jgi:hypothetical protein
MADNLLAEQAWVRILRHLERNPIQSEAEMRRDLKTVIRAAEVAIGITLDIDVGHILEGAALLVSR